MWTGRRVEPCWGNGCQATPSLYQLLLHNNYPTLSGMKQSAFIISHECIGQMDDSVIWTMLSSSWQDSFTSLLSAIRLAEDYLTSNDLIPLAGGCHSFFGSPSYTYYSGSSKVSGGWKYARSNSRTGTSSHLLHSVGQSKSPMCCKLLQSHITKVVQKEEWRMWPFLKFPTIAQHSLQYMEQKAIPGPCCCTFRTL